MSPLMSLIIDYYRNTRVSTHIRQISILSHCVLDVCAPSILYKFTQIPIYFPHLSIIRRVMWYFRTLLTRLTLQFSSY
jgi:hypothetical protein